MSNKTSWIILVFVLIVAGFFRIWHLNYNPARETRPEGGGSPIPASTPPGLFSDEAMNGNNAFEALRTRNFKIFYPENNGREGLFINIQALSISIFGNTAFALRIASALFGILTVIAIFLFTREYLGSNAIALLAAYFLSTSFWHIMFSRIGFRAIMAPFFLTMGLWALYYVWNRIKTAGHAHLALVSVAGGILFGLGFYSYIAYRIAPILLLPALILFYKKAQESRDTCLICLPALFLFFVFVVTVPIGLFFLQNPADFLGRTAQISIFSSQNPAAAFFKNAGEIIQMFYIAGDFNPRHNLPGQPALWWPVALFFTIGAFTAFRKKYWLLFLWFFIMLLPVAFSSEGLPHSLRAIIMIPPVMVLAALGFHKTTTATIALFKRAESKFPEAADIIKRIQKLIYVFAFAILLCVAGRTYIDYFLRWEIMPKTQEAFDGNLYAIGLFLNQAPRDIPKYVITSEVDSIDISGRPMKFQPILFASETYRPEPAGAKNIYYLALKDIDTITCAPDCMVIPIDNLQPTLGLIKKRIPTLELAESNHLLVARPKRYHE